MDFFEGVDGKRSFMRIAGAIGIVIGGGLAVCGAVMGFLRLSDGLAITEITSGAGLISLIMGAKAWQSQAENKNGFDTEI